jgi:hypothetical protein
VRTALEKLRDHLTTDGSRCTGDENSFHDRMVAVRRCLDRRGLW